MRIDLEAVPCLPRRRPHPVVLLLVSMLLAPAAGGASLAAQTTLERTPLLGDASVGMPWTLVLGPEFRFRRAAEGLQLRTTIDVALGLPAWTSAGARYTAQSVVVPGSPDEWELYGRWAGLAEARGAPVDAVLQAGYNGAARSPDAELALAHRVGPVRLLGVGRVLGSAEGTGETRGALGAGIIVYPHPRGMPLSLSADAVTPLDRDAPRGERVAWSAAVNLGVSYSPHTLSLFATNTRSASLQGTSFGVSRMRLGLVFTAPLAAGRLLGLVVAREDAMRAVTGDATPSADMVSADIYRYAYPQYRLEIRRGTTIEWTNRDDVVHTVTADDGSWDSGGMQPGARWRARFDEPGIYPFHCGPHPFMQGVVVVR